MTAFATFIFIGDIIVCGFLAALAAWLFTRGDTAGLEEAARIPLQDDDE